MRSGGEPLFPVGGNGMNVLQQYRYEILLAGILILSAFLNIWNIWDPGYSNVYYAAAVRSMLENPSMLLFNAFDAAGFITVDKPPVGLWVQAASAALLGFSGWSLVLPQALAGVGSVALVWLIVSRAFGKPAGLVSAFALAITPIFVAISRNGTMDGILIFVLLLAVWVGLKAARESSLPCLLLAVVLVGIGFNIKMIQAFIVVPAVFAIYLLGAKEHLLKKRMAHIIIAIAVLAVVSLSWAIAVDSIPADQRPYIGGSGDNTVLGLIINYNGIHRLGGDSSGRGSGPAGLSPGPADDGGMAAPAGDVQNRTLGRTMGAISSDQPPPFGMDQGRIIGGSMQGYRAGGQWDVMEPGMIQASSVPGTPHSDVAPANGRGGMGDETGSPGITRLFSEGLAGQLSWLLPFALVGLLAFWKRPDPLSWDGLEHSGLFSERGLTLMAMGLWLLPGLLYFSFTTGFWHIYYIATIAPPLAALAGIGTVAMFGAYLDGGDRAWILPCSIFVTGLLQVVFLLYTATWSGPLTVIVGAGTVAFVILLAIIRLRKHEGRGIVPRIVAAGAIALLFIAPLVWACTPLMYGSGGNLPTAGPRLSEQGGGGMDATEIAGPGITMMHGSTPSGTTSSLAKYLLAHTTNETWIVAMPSSMSAASLVIETGKPVMALGGFAGSDQVLTLDKMKQMVADGKVRYFSLSSRTGGGASSGNSAIFSWVQTSCTAISSAEWNDSGGTGDSNGGGQESLYDCAGYRESPGT
jgi:4-amino-4-deoxy-L-arabinose transferase-like glycosyltransferase